MAEIKRGIGNGEWGNYNDGKREGEGEDCSIPLPYFSFSVPAVVVAPFPIPCFRFPAVTVDPQPSALSGVSNLQPQSSYPDVRKWPVPPGLARRPDKCSI
jgi:hypothetical protein